MAVGVAAGLQRGDDAVARYVATFGEIGHLHERLSARALFLPGGRVERGEPLHAAVVRFLAGLGAAVSDPVQSGEIVRLLQAGQNLLAIAELIGVSLVRLARLRLERGLLAPHDLARRVRALHDILIRDFTATVAALADNDATLARSVRAAKRELHELARELTADAFREVAGQARERVRAFTGVMEALEVLTRIHRLCRKTARLVLDAQPPDLGAAQPAAAPAGAG